MTVLSRCIYAVVMVSSLLVGTKGSGVPGGYNPTPSTPAPPVSPAAPTPSSPTAPTPSGDYGPSPSGPVSPENPTPAPTYPSTPTINHDLCGGGPIQPTAPTTPVPTPAPTQPPQTYPPQTQPPAPVAPAPAPAPVAYPPAGGAPNKIYQHILDQTNIIRAQHGYPPVRWNQDIANRVQQKANSCPGFNHFEIDGYSSWQNLASGSPCADGSANLDTCQPASKSEPYRWYYDEANRWNYQYKTCTDAYGQNNWLKCGHFVIQTQAATQEMGCGYSDCYGDKNVWCDYVGNGMEKLPTMNSANYEQVLNALQSAY